MLKKREKQIKTNHILANLPIDGMLKFHKDVIYKFKVDDSVTCCGNTTKCFDIF